VESVIWGLRTLDPILLATPVLVNLILLLTLTQFDFILLLATRWFRTAFRIPESFRPLSPGERPTGLVIIPSLLRGRDDLRAITTTVESAATNEYPSDLFVIASVDGRTEFPELYAELLRWVGGRRYAPNVRVHVAGTPTRLGKMMAVEAGVQHMRGIVERGEYPEFPKVYFSVDGDGTLGKRALERLAHQLARRSPVTGNPRRIVSGKICVRPDLFWRGWRRFFSVSGQLYLLAGREFLVSNVSRFNWKWTPRIGVPGALYCTWSELLLQAPYFMSFMKTIRARDWLRWWLGHAPPTFSTSERRSLPDALTGASDDTCMAFLASLASFRRGALSLDAPRTPLHALGRMLRAYFYDRSHQYEPEARVYTYTPPTLRGLWRQRVRWNSSRVECAGRFSRAFSFHWEIGMPTGAHLWNLINTVFEIVGYYVILPYYVLGEAHALLGYLLGYSAQTLAYTLYTLMALVLERERRLYLPVLLSLPIASFYQICMNAFGCVYGVTRDIFLFGNATNFAPEWTLKKGGCVRIATLFRVRRFLALSVRALLYGDVPFGSFWFGWRETAWTPSGFEGWTTGRKPPPIVPRPRLEARLRTWRPALRLAGATLAALAVASASINAISVRSVAPEQKRPADDRRRHVDRAPRADGGAVVVAREREAQEVQP
jgi:cellulose synthase/poly-beta-1,6-N-acetylglucosamine synthase-like glycosyltransferase